MGIQGSGRVGGRWGRRFALSVSTILATGAAFPALAQSPHPNIDKNGVDLTTGLFELRLPIASIGSGEAELPLVAYDGQTDNWSNIWLYQEKSGGTTRYAVVTGRTFDNFTSTSAVSTRGTGATLTGTPTEMIYRTLDGVEVTFTNPKGTSTGASNLCDENNTNLCYLLPQSIVGLSRMRVDMEWEIDSVCSGLPMPDQDQDCVHNWRLTTVSNLAGYSASWAYASDNPGTGPVWHRPVNVMLKNNGATVSTVAYANPSSGVYTITKPGGGVWRITGSGNVISGVRRPGASNDTMTIARSAGVVTSITNDGITTSYNRSVSGNTVTMVVTDAQSHATTIVSDLSKYRPISITDALGKTTSMAYDSLSRPTEITNPEGDKVQYSYDNRSNVTEVRRKAKPGAGLPDIVTTASFPAACMTLSCNSPDTTTDQKGNVTNYSYDSLTGLLTKVTLPAATSGAKRPEKRYSYTINGAGIHLVSSVSQCRTGSPSDTPTCIGTADETIQSNIYDANLNVTSATIAAGDNSLSATSSSTYSAAGDLLTANGPLPGADDTTTYRYDADRRVLGTISPDPDGVGALKRRARKITYDAGGRVADVELGTVNGTSDTDWAGFISARKLSSIYDGNGFRIREIATSASVTYQVTQYSYDSLGRVECTALRMNSGTWSSLPADACALQVAGSFGEDRISKSTYDSIDRVVKVQTGYGTTAQIDEVTTVYGDNGQISSVTDAEGNKTSYAYDGFGRLTRAYYPNSTKGSGASSSTDYEEASYNSFGEISANRLRDGTLVSYIYDNVGQKIRKNPPGSEYYTDYSYDLLGHVTSVSRPGDGMNHSYSYDALGRLKGENQPFGATSYEYDSAGRRTRLTWWDGLFVDYDYMTTGEMSAIRENGSTSGAGVLARFSYDDLGRRISLDRGNGTSTSYAYDSMSRLSSLSQNLAGASFDVTNEFSYNPAGQPVSQSRNNDAYSWGAHVNGGRTYLSNGLNQLTSSGGTSLGYDARGNLTSSGSSTFSYTSGNLLKSANSTISLRYDGLGRLVEYSAASPTRFVYDGVHIAAEVAASGGTVLRRYVFGPGSDEALVWYEGAGTGDRRWLHADERGSIVAATNASGAVIGINSYDEYGIPASSSLGRFAYTGQAWFPELGLYYYKARFYSATLGRFLQTDPIGYGSGLNWYAYVGNNPIAAVDPSGLCGKNQFSYTVTGSRITQCGDLPGGGKGGSGSSGSGQSGGQATKSGGPLDGQTGCGGCITPDSASEERIRASVFAHQGFYFGNQWVHVNVMQLAGGLSQERMVLLGTIAVGAGAMGLAVRALSEGVVLAEGAAVAEGDHIVLGISRFGLEQTATKVGGRTLTSDLAWRETLQAGLANPSTRFTLSLDGFRGATTTSQVMGAAERGVGPLAYHTEWEVSQLYQSGRLGTTGLYSNGRYISNPFAP